MDFSDSKIYQDLALVPYANEKDQFVNKYNIHAYFFNVINNNSYGGMLVAQGAYACAQTIDHPGFILDATQCKFMNAVLAKAGGIIYKVERLRDSKRMIHRQVKIIQKNQVCFIMTCIFVNKNYDAINNKKFGIQPDVNKCPDFESIKNSKLWKIINKNELQLDKDYFNKTFQRWDEKHTVANASLSVYLDHSESHLKNIGFTRSDILEKREVWVGMKVVKPNTNAKINGKDDADLILKTILCYISDFLLSDSSFRILGVPHKTILFSTSVDHNIYFCNPKHKDLSYDSIIMYNVKLINADHGRVLVSCTLYNEFGESLALITQQSLCIYKNLDGKLLKGKL